MWTWENIVEHAKALTTQWSVDTLKRPSITDLQRYGHLVAHFNGLHSEGIMPDTQNADTIMDLLIENMPLFGYAAIGTMLDVTYRADWEGDWPVPQPS